MNKKNVLGYLRLSCDKIQRGYITGYKQQYYFIPTSDYLSSYLLQSLCILCIIIAQPNSRNLVFVDNKSSCVDLKNAHAHPSERRVPCQYYLWSETSGAFIPRFLLSLISQLESCKPHLMGPLTITGRQIQFSILSMENLQSTKCGTIFDTVLVSYNFVCGRSLLIQSTMMSEKNKCYLHCIFLFLKLSDFLLYEQNVESQDQLPLDPFQIDLANQASTLNLQSSRKNGPDMVSVYIFS